MLNFIYGSLKSFRPAFSRRSTWFIFAMIAIAFLGATQIMGVTTFCRFWGLGEDGYHIFLHFFRSNAWSIDSLFVQWSSFVLKQNLTIKTHGRAILLGDHTNTPKDGRFMPGVVSLHEKSETQSKPSYFRGHCWGAIGLLIGTLNSPFCIPLLLKIHQGFVHIDKEAKDHNDKETMCTRIVNMAIIFALLHNLPSILILDAYFSCGSVFKLANYLWSIEMKQPLVTLIIRAKKNYTAYFEVDASKQPVIGRKRKYGEKVLLMELFDHLHMFSTQKCTVYGKVEDVTITALNLLWKPTGELVRFVLAVTSHGRIILMCSDLNQDPILALELYSKRVRIEVMFDMLKNLIGCFSYHFWTKHMPRHSRKPKKNKTMTKPNSPHSIKVTESCWKSYEGFVMIGGISLGLLQLIALKFGDYIWDHFEAFLRTRSRDIPSERTVKHVIGRLLMSDFLSLAPSAIMNEIRERFSHGFHVDIASKNGENHFALS